MVERNLVIGVVTMFVLAAGATAGLDAAIAGEDVRRLPARSASVQASPAYMLGVRLDNKQVLSGLPAYQGWLGRTVGASQIAQSTQGTTWEEFPNLPQSFYDWVGWQKANPRGRWLTMIINMFPGDKNVQVPPEQIAANLRAGARGDFDQYFRAKAANMVQAGLGRAYFAIGNEAQGNWNNQQYGPDVVAWKAYWRRIANIFHAASPKFKTAFVMGIQAFTEDLQGNPVPIDRAWPGDDVVDVAGVDFFDGNYGYYDDSRPYSEQWAQIWDAVIVADNPPRNNYGLNWWARFNAEHGNKPFVLQTWGVNKGGDNTYLIQRVYEWLATHHVAYANYFDVGGVRLSPPTRFPNSSALYKRLFGGDGSGVDLTPPSASITQPADGETVSGDVRVAAVASDATAVIKVDFLLNGALLGTDRTAPFELNWNTSGLVVGSSHFLKARAEDANGNVGKSARVNVVIGS
jgi:Big-like domain-containing protein